MTSSIFIGYRVLARMKMTSRTFNSSRQFTDLAVPRFPRFSLSLRSIDLHAAGEPARVIVGGMPAVEGTTMMEKRKTLMDQMDYIRKLLLLGLDVIELVSLHELITSITYRRTKGLSMSECKYYIS
jgi:hypothetical protein